MAALVFRIKACNCQSSATSFTVFQNPWWLGNLHELHNRELHSPLSSMYANNRQMSQHHPNKHCFPWLLSVLLRFSERSSTESRNTRSRIFVSSSGSSSVTYQTLHMSLLSRTMCVWIRFCNSFFTNSVFINTTHFALVILNFISTLLWQKA